MLMKSDEVCCVCVCVSGTLLVPASPPVNSADSAHDSHEKGKKKRSIKVNSSSRHGGFSFSALNVRLERKLSPFADSPNRLDIYWSRVAYRFHLMGFPIQRNSFGKLKTIQMSHNRPPSLKSDYKYKESKGMRKHFKLRRLLFFM